MPIERRPVLPVSRSWKVQHGTSYRVRDGDSWSSLARRFGISEQALVFANFQTLVPAEVNWYLRHYVGCRRPTGDGHNWMFSASASPGIIHIPPTSYDMPEEIIEGQLPPRYFTVATRPEDWSPPADSPDGGTAARSVVTRAPWGHTNLSIGSVRVQTRKEWGAGEPIWSNEVIYYNTAWPLAQVLTTIVIHHTDNDESIKVNERREQGRGYAAIGYHFFIDQSGKVLEGRPLEIMGSHAGTGLTSGPLNDPDWGAIGIVLQGDYHHADDWLSSDSAPTNQLRALRELITALRAQYSGINALLMHKEVIRGGAATVCPGDSLYDAISSMRTELGLGR